MRRLNGWALAALAISGGGCLQIIGYDDARPGWNGTGVGASGGGGGATSSTGGGDTCSNGKRDGNETGKDCGGSCSPCPVGEGCLVGSDCQSKSCGKTGTCVASQCNDEVKNGDETDTDCGGSCSPCVNGQGCAENTDCTSGTCKDAKCIDPVLWKKDFGSGVTIAAAATDSSGNIRLLANVSQGDVSFGGDPLYGTTYPTAAIAGLTSSGDHVWSHIFNGQGAGDGIAVSSLGSIGIVGTGSGNIDLGGGPLTGSGTSNLFVAKYDPSGMHLWSKAFASGVSGAFNIAATPSDGFVVTGPADPMANFGCGPLAQRGVLVVAFDMAGKCLWNKGSAANLAYNQLGRSVAVDSAGNVYVTGTANGVITFGGPTSTAMGLDTFLAKLDSGGNQKWIKLFGDANSNNPHSYVTVTPSGNIVLAGGFTGSIDFGKGPLKSQGGVDIFVAELDPNGGGVWAKSFGNASDQSVTGVAVDEAGSVVVVGQVGDTGTSVDFGGGPVHGDRYIAKFDSAGNYAWSGGGGSGIASAGMGQFFMFGDSGISKLQTP